ncbi:MAG: radical SAM protein [Helicobacteraceae bacterium]|jgi:wyosine [tRNA(Phe)-imidazoG37] synthetase (radical SAM superfamily)|nr:radical SAM protein [Helicobacteraceae bacterium]
MSFVFGPVSSRRFGLSLGIDLSPDRKRCNYDCLYCELSKAKPIAVFDEPADWREIASEVKEALKTCSPDKLTITANGEPTLYPYLNALIDELNAIKNGAKLMILSNGATIGVPSVTAALAKLDIVKLSLDAAEEKAFKKVDRPRSSFANLGAVINGMINFRARYMGELVIETLLVGGANDTADNFNALALALNKIRPDRIDIGTIERPSAYKVQAASAENMRLLADRLAAIGLNARIIPSKYINAKCSFDRIALLALLQRRSLSDFEAAAILDETALALLSDLVSEGLATIKTLGEKRFYAKADLSA